MVERVVCTLTTIPGRYKQLKRTLKSLHLQTYRPDAIYLSIPERCSRLKQAYPKLPRSITDLCTVVRISRDYGPISKLVGALLRELEPETIIISVDDDRIYDSSLIEALVKKSRKNPGSAIGSAGFRIGTFPFYLMGARSHQKSPFLEWFSPDFETGDGTVDILAGYSAIAYRRSFFPSPTDLEGDLLDHALDHPDLFKNDDVLISAYLDSRGIKRRIFRLPDNISQLSSNGLADDIPRFIKSCIRAIQECSRRGLFKSRCDVTPIRTATGGIIFIVLIVFLLLLMLLYFTSV